MQDRDILDAIATFVCERMQLTREDLFSTRREDIPARALFVWIARAQSRGMLTFAAIGASLGDRDHSTVSYLYHVVAPRLRASDRAFAAICDSFQSEEKLPCR